MTAAPPAAVSVQRWGERRGAKNLPGVLRVMAGGQDAGAIEHRDGAWHAVRQARALGPVTETAHADAGKALRAVLRSGFARRLGARAASAVYWSAEASRLVARAAQQDARAGR